MLRAEDLWRIELEGLVEDLTGGAQRFPQYEEEYFPLERALLYSAFIVRKLVEDGAVDEATKSRSVKLRAHEARDEGELPERAGERNLNANDYFDMNASTPQQLSYFNLASELMHADGLIWLPEADAVGAFFMFSYRNRKRALVVPMATYIELLKRIVEGRVQR